ncbi:uncharacterized protein LOC143876875 [Tasmannia lanceolata]|uniref:uncharacterized protein LOC143876875 n=1 Tax=Tasmannia lanceolata TaxID=3420 RepID=UPI0040646D44
MEEIEVPVNSMPKDNAPGPDGFPMDFYQRFWGMIKMEVLDYMNEFHGRRVISKEANTTFITLIPKKGAVGMKDYMPISLVHSMYKILAKVLAHRISSVMEEIISNYQGAFVKDRQILDGILIANEILDTVKRDDGCGFLFKLDLEKAYVLSELIVKAEQCSYIKGLKPSRSSPTVSHLQFTDDTVLFLDAGLKINFSKSVVTGINLNSQAIEMMAGCLGCQQVCFPMSYLGLPLGCGIPKAAQWDPVVERIERKLASWKKKVPVKIEKRIERLQQDFLWEGMEGDRRSRHLLNWKKIVKSKSNGGIGIGRIRLGNKSLLGKWLWRFGVENEALWHSIIVEKYGAGWGIGYVTSLAGELWLSGSRLTRLGRHSILISDFGQARICDYLQRNEGLDQNIWDIRLRRNMKDEELDHFTEMIQMLRDITYPRTWKIAGYGSQIRMEGSRPNLSSGGWWKRIVGNLVALSYGA